MSSNKSVIYKDVETIDSLLQGGESVNRDLLIVALYIEHTTGERDIVQRGNNYYYHPEDVYLSLEEYVLKIDAPIEITTYVNSKGEKITKAEYNKLSLDERVKYEEQKSYKPNSLSNSLKHAWERIKEVLELNGLNPDDICEAKLDKSKGVAKKDRKTYYRYLIPDFSILQMLNKKEQEDEKTKVMKVVDKFCGNGKENPKEAIQRRKELILQLDDIQRENVKKILLELEDEILEAEKNGDILNVNRKYLTALECALINSDALDMAVYLKKYLDFKHSAPDTNFDIDTNISSNQNDDIIEKCLDIILRHTDKTIQDIDRIIKEGTNNNVLGEIAKAFESQIFFLRRIDSPALSDVLFAYGKFCHSIYDIDNAVKCFNECRDIDLRKFKSIGESFRTAVDLAIVYDNLAVLYFDFGYIDDANENLQESIDLFEKMFRIMPSETNYIVLAMLYNTLGGILAKQFDYEASEEAYDKAFEYISKELSMESYSYNEQAESLCIMIELNSAILAFHQGDIDSIAELDLTSNKCKLLSTAYPTSDNLKLYAQVENVYALGLSVVGDCDFALEIAEEALEVCNKLCEISFAKYALDKTYILRRISDIYDKMGESDKAISYLNEGIQICRDLNIETNLVARVQMLATQSDYARLLCVNKQFVKASDVCKEVCEGYEQLGDISPEYLLEAIKMLNNWAMVLYEIGKKEDAILRQQHAMSLLEDAKDDIGDEYSGWYQKLSHDMAIFKS